MKKLTVRYIRYALLLLANVGFKLSLNSANPILPVSENRVDKVTLPRKTAPFATSVIPATTGHYRSWKHS
jgi:hypothetical protein